MLMKDRGVILGSLRCPWLLVFLIHRVTCSWTAIVLTAPNWLAAHDIVQFLFCNFDCILFYHMYIAAPVEGRYKKCVFFSSSSQVCVSYFCFWAFRCFEMAILAFSRKISSYPSGCLSNSGRICEKMHRWLVINHAKTLRSTYCTFKAGVVAWLRGIVVFFFSFVDWQRGFYLKKLERIHREKRREGMEKNRLESTPLQARDACAFPLSL